MSNLVRTAQVSLDDLRQYADQQRLFAILDACDSPQVLSKVLELGPDRARCLFKGEIAQEARESAPYLTACDGTILHWLFHAVWEEPWGIFIVGQVEQDRLLRHLRKFLIVRDPSGEAVYFRYYDPRVLPVFLSSCSREELLQFYGEISAFGCTHEGAQGVQLVYPEV